MSFQNIEQDLVFIGGHRKAGTSMFNDLFDGHPQIINYPPDLTILYAYFPDFIKKTKDKTKLLKRLDLLTAEEIKLCYLDAQVDLPNPIEKFKKTFFDQIKTDDDLKDLRKIISQLIITYSSWSNQSNRSKFLLKETSLEIYANEIFNWFPNSKIIQTMRDPRDNYAALKAGVKKKYLKLGEDENATLASLIHRLGTSMRIGLINQKTYKNRYKIIKFEDLTSEAQLTLKDICDWLNIKFDESLLKPSKISKPTKGNNFEGDMLFEISNKNVGAWKQRITEEEAKIIEFHLGDLMIKYGYELEYSNKEAAKSASNFYKWSNYQYFYSDRFKSGV